VGAAGVHWPFAEWHEARRWRNRFDLMSVSAHGRAELCRIDAQVFDAALLSAVFPSRSPSAGPPLGAHTLRNLSRRSPVPVYALGGINSRNAASISDAAGLAAIEGIRDPFRS
jgi:thiamine-phosphate pyrophosphorylase